MKKMILMCALLISTSALFAEFDLGLKAGYTTSIGFSNISSVGDYTWSQAKSEMGSSFQVGAFARIGSKFYVQPELLFNYGKTDYKISFKDAIGGNLTLNKFVTTQTIDVPILFGVKLLDLKVVDLRLLAGPKFRFNAGTKINFKDNDDFASDVADEIRKATIGLEAGVGTEILGFINVDVRYNLIQSLTKTTSFKGNVAGEYKNPNNTFVLSLGFKLL